MLIPRVDQMQPRLAPACVDRTPQRLTVEDHLSASQRFGHARGEGDQRLFQRRGLNPPEHLLERVGVWRARALGIVR